MATVTNAAEPLQEHFNKMLLEAEEIYLTAKEHHDELYEEYMQALREHSDDEDTSYIDSCRYRYEMYLEIYTKISNAYECIENACQTMRKYSDEVNNEVMTYFRKGDIFVDKVIRLISSMREVPVLAQTPVQEFTMGKNTGTTVQQSKIGQDKSIIEEKINSIYNDPNLTYQQKISRLNTVLSTLRDSSGNNSMLSSTPSTVIAFNIFTGDQANWLRDNYSQCCSLDEQNISSEERTSLYEYSLDGYKDMNAYLDGRPMFIDIPQYVEQVKKHVDNISCAIERNCLKHDTFLYRGHSFRELFSDAEDHSILTFDELKDKYINTYHDKPSFVSTSTKPDVANQFGECVLEINAPKGTPALCLGGISAYDGEAEVLLQKNMRYRIDDIVKENGKIHVKVTLVGRRK